MTAQQLQVVLNCYEPHRTDHGFEWWLHYLPFLDGLHYLPMLLFNRLSSGRFAMVSREYKTRAAAHADLANAARPLYFEAILLPPPVPLPSPP